MAAAYYTVTLNIISLFCIWFHPRYHVLNKLALKGLVNVTHKPPLYKVWATGVNWLRVIVTRS